MNVQMMSSIGVRQEKVFRIVNDRVANKSIETF